MSVSVYPGFNGVDDPVWQTALKFELNFFNFFQNILTLLKISLNTGFTLLASRKMSTYVSFFQTSMGQAIMSAKLHSNLNWIFLIFSQYTDFTKNFTKSRLNCTCIKKNEYVSLSRLRWGRRSCSPNCTQIASIMQRK